MIDLIGVLFKANKIKKAEEVILKLKENTKIMIMAPVIRKKRRASCYL